MVECCMLGTSPNSEPIPTNVFPSNSNTRLQTKQVTLHDSHGAHALCPAYQQDDMHMKQAAFWLMQHDNNCRA